MADRLDPNDFGLKLYNRFPPSYRLDDADQKYALRRYLESAADGGFRYIIEEQNGILDLINPQTSPLQVIYLLYEQYGLDLFHRIPEEFLRAFLPNVGLAWAKKGSLDVVEYIVSSLSGIKTSTKVTYDDFDNPVVTVRLEMDFNLSDYFPDTKQFERILENFIPFYCDALIIYSYVYSDFGNIHSEEFAFDFIKEFGQDTAHIPYAKGYRYYPVLNDTEVGLNNGFILNHGFEIEQDPDVLVMDILKWLYEDVCNIGSVYANLFNPTLNMDTPMFNQYTKPHNALNEDLVLNGDVITSACTYWTYPSILLNHNLVLSDFVETDSVKDAVTYLPAEDNPVLADDDRTLDNLHLAPVEDSTMLGGENVFILNSSVLNTGVIGVIEIDEYFDVMYDTKQEVSEIGSKYSLEYVEELPILNTGFILNETLNVTSYLRTDGVLDKFSYIENETGVIDKSEDETMLIKLQPEEDITRLGHGDVLILNTTLINSSNLGEIEADEFEDSLSYISNESCNFDSTLIPMFSSNLNCGAGLNELVLNSLIEVDSVSDKLLLSPIRDFCGIFSYDSHMENLSDVHSENGVIRSLGNQDLLNDKNGVHLAYGQNADIVKDTIHSVFHDSISIAGSIEDRTTVMNWLSELNENFILNEFSRYDKVTVNGNTSVLFV